MNYLCNNVFIFLLLERLAELVTIVLRLKVDKMWDYFSYSRVAGHSKFGVFTGNHV